MAVDSQAPQANGLKTVLDTIVAPKEAFESIRIVPTWGWALAIAILLAAVASYLIVPAVQHAIASDWPSTVASNPRLGALTPAQQQTQLLVAQRIAAFTWIFVIVVVPIYCLIEAVIMLLFDKLGRGDGSFAKYFAASCNIAVPVAGIGGLVNSVIVIMRGPAAFNTGQSVQSAVPSLAMLVPSATGKLAALLATVTPFTIWATALSIAALLIVGRVRPFQAWLGGIVLFLIPALIAVAFAK